MKNMKRSVALLVAIALLIGCAAGGTMAWLMDKTTAVTNTFVAGNINIELTEHEYDPTTNDLTATETSAGVNNYKMVPGITLPKDPTVTVAEKSEACWLFVKVEESFETITDGSNTYNFNDFLSYSVDEGTDKWTKGDGTDIPYNVYYRQVSASASAQSYGILAGDKVTVPGDVTKAMMDTVGANSPTLKFTAYAHQVQNGDSTFDAKTAWGQVKGL